MLKSGAKMKERLDAIMKETGNLFFELGRLHYQVEQDSQEISDTKTKLHNLKIEATKLKKQVAAEIKLAPPPEAPVASPQGAITPEIPGA